MLNIFDSDKITLLYSVHCQQSKPQLTLCRLDGGDTPLRIATITTKSLSSTMKINIEGNAPFIMKSTFASSRHSITLPQLAGEWASNGILTSNFNFRSLSGRKMAEFEFSSWSRKKKGKIHLMEPLSQPALDALIVTAIARFHRQQQKKKLAAGINGAVGGGGSG